MISFVTGSIFDADVEALVNPVNTKGAMGKGLAKEFKVRYKPYYQDYVELCRQNKLRAGETKVYYRGFLESPMYLISFSTKDDWRDPSLLTYIETGLDSLASDIVKLGIQSIALPALGCGLGGLAWLDVKGLITDKLQPLNDCRVIVYNPATAS